jgi:FkbH-like protein
MPNDLASPRTIGVFESLVTEAVSCLGPLEKNLDATLLDLASRNALRFFELLDEVQLPDSITTASLSLAVLRALPAVSAGRDNFVPRATRILDLYAGRLSSEAVAKLIRIIGKVPTALERAAVDRAIDFHIQSPAVLRAGISLLLTTDEPTRLNLLLSHLATVEPTQATLAFVYRSRPLPRPDEDVMRIALVSSYTIDTIVPYVDLAVRRHGLTPSFYVAPFNSWTSEFLDPNSGLRQFSPTLVCLAVSIDDLEPRLSGTLLNADLESAADSAIARVLNSVNAFIQWGTGIPIIVHSFHSAFRSPLGLFDLRSDNSRSEWLARLNVRLAAELRALPDAHLLDVASTVAQGGGSLQDNPKLRHLAAMRLPPESLRTLADEIGRYAVASVRVMKKCVVLDLDNTLWGGVVGEDTKDGIHLSRTGKGSEFVEFQEYLLSLTERGVLLAICSKNNAADALEVLRDHESMVIRESHVSAMRINWEPKPENIVSIAEELNIGLDSIVFVDDNPDEREQMRQRLPQVLTVEMPRDSTQYRSVLERLPELQTLAITSEDRLRSQQYQTAQLRAQTKSRMASVEDYLASLDIEIEISQAKDQDLARIAQLFAKTNQFNVTTRRYDAPTLAAMLENPRWKFWVLRSRDKFGDHGLVALALIDAVEPIWEIDSFLMSCRVIGYGIETALLTHIGREARSVGGHALNGTFVPTKKNVPARDLFAQNGFTPRPPNHEGERWHRDLQSELTFAHHLKVHVS